MFSHHIRSVVLAVSLFTLSVPVEALAQRNPSPAVPGTPLNGRPGSGPTVHPPRPFSSVTIDWARMRKSDNERFVDNKEDLRDPDVAEEIDEKPPRFYYAIQVCVPVPGDTPACKEVFKSGTGDTDRGRFNDNASGGKYAHLEEQPISVEPYTLSMTELAQYSAEVKDKKLAELIAEWEKQGKSPSEIASLTNAKWGEMAGILPKVQVVTFEVRKRGWWLWRGPSDRVAGCTVLDIDQIARMTGRGTQEVPMASDSRGSVQSNCDRILITSNDEKQESARDLEKLAEKGKYPDEVADPAVAHHWSLGKAWGKLNVTVAPAHSGGGSGTGSSAPIGPGGPQPSGKKLGSQPAAAPSEDALKKYIGMMYDPERAPGNQNAAETDNYLAKEVDATAPTPVTGAPSAADAS